MDQSSKDPGSQLLMRFDLNSENKSSLGFDNKWNFMVKNLQANLMRRFAKILVVKSKSSRRKPRRPLKRKSSLSNGLRTILSSIKRTPRFPKAMIVC